MEANTIEKTKLRKYEHTLVISGAGVIVFGIWSVIKAAIYMIVMPLKQMSVFITDEDLVNLQGAGLSERVADYTMAVVFLVILLVDLWLRYYVGRSAMRDGRKTRRKSPAYIIWAGVLSAGLLMSIVTNLCGGSALNSASGTDVEAQRQVLDTMSVSGLVDLTSLLALIQMIIAGIMVRRLRRKLAKDRGEAA